MVAVELGRTCANAEAAFPVGTDLHSPCRLRSVDLDEGKAAAVLGIGKLTVGGEAYYLNVVAKGVEDYYLGSGEAPGYWLGKGAARFGLSGRVDPEALGRVLGGLDPHTGDRLARAGERVPGFDTTFRAPKSVSLLYALADPDVSREVTAAHDAAVAAALEYLQTHAGFARRGAGGITQIATEGFVAAAFRHRTSRAGDPLLHTHVLLANLVEGVDGRWSSFDARALYAHAKTAGYLYQAHLRHELTHRLAVAWEPVRRGSADLAGVDRDVIKAFSRRREEIVERMSERGETSPKAAQKAALDTRRTKAPADQVADPAFRTHRARDYGVAPTDAPQLGEWRDRARRLGFGDAELDALTGRGRPLTPVEREALHERITAELVGSDGLTAQASSFTRRDVLRAWCDRLPQGTTVAEIERLADVTLASSAVRKLKGQPRPASPRHCDVIRRADGRTVRVAADQERYSTIELLAAEAAVIDSALSRRNAGVGQIRGAAPLEAALAARPTLGEDQVEMVRRLTTSGAGVEVVIGRPGTGKTYAVGTARTAWEAAGFTVRGAALAAQAAKQLQDGAGIESHTVDSLLADLDRGGRLAPRTVLVVDEAGMVGTRKLARLFRHAEAAKAKVVLIGDHHQLPEIDAGGVFRGLHDRLTTVELTENRRQVAGWERGALDSYRAGRPAEALAAYEARERLTISGDAADRRKTMVEDWWQARTRGEDTLMLAARRADVDALNTAARQRRIDAAELGADVATIAGTPYAVGDEVMTLRNRHALGIRNGTRATVLAAEGAGLRVRTQDGADVHLPDWYLKAGWVSHAYATTVHKGQGATCDRALLLANDALFREAGYVGLSRARHHTQLYLVLVPEPDDSLSHSRARGAPYDPISEIARALAGSRAKRLAHDTVPQNRRSSPAPSPHPEPRSPLYEAPVAPDSPPRRPEPTVEPPRYLRAALGKRPADGERRAVWDSARERIEEYRADYGVDDPTRALGRKLGIEPDQQAARAAVEQAIQEARLVLSRQPHLGINL